ncbi:MAG: TonB-dependent receptor, partial [Opitutaceae bacterium]
MKDKISLAIIGAWLALAFAPGPAASAADGRAAIGMIEGRVLNIRNGEYLENARLTIEGTSLETFTDSSGQFRLGPVRAGNVKVRVFFTGLEPLTDTVVVATGETVSRDFNLGGVGAGPGGGVVKLSEFVVGASREMAGAAIAINEQRFAPNIKNVVSTEEFGHVAEGNVGEFLKFLPGVTVEYGGGYARGISINGVPSANVPVTIDGFNLASTGGDNNTGRSVQVDMASINNIARIEVSHSPTPESQGAALAGSVNMVPRSSFERVRPVFNTTVSLVMRDNARDFRETAGPREHPTRKVHPSFDFSYVVPVNKRFGFTLSGGTARQYTAEDLSQNTWRGTSAATNGAAFPHTSPDQPYLSSYRVQDAPKDTTRRSFGVTIDYKLTRSDRLSFSFQYFSFNADTTNRSLTFNVNRVLPGNFTTTSTRGAAAAGDLLLAQGGRDRINRTYMPTLVWRHDGPVWKAEAGAGHSQGSNRVRDIDKGFFNNTQARRTDVTVAFDDLFYLRPGRITVTDAAGAPVDPFSLSSYALASSNSIQNDSTDIQRSAYANLRRDFNGRVPLTLKGGLDVRHALRDVRGGTRLYSFVGADGRPSTNPIGSDDSAAPYLDPSFSQRVLPFGFPRAQWNSNEQLWALYQARPNYFTIDPNASYRSAVGLSKLAEEVISSAFLRADAQFFERRLKLIGGVRAEQTNISAEGPLTDATRNFQRDAAGRVLLGANGRPLTLLPASDALGVSKLTFLDRGLHAEKEYLRWFPSLNASFNVRENLIARAAYYQSVGRPSFNQYAGGLTLPDTESPPSPANRISVNNVGIKAWDARTVKLRLEYYFEGVGQISVGAFRRNFENFFGNTVLNATPEFLSLYSLDPAIYGLYDVATQYNVPGTVRMEGLEFDYKQALTFAPPWARGLQVFANASAQRALGDANGDFAGYVPRSASWGLSLTRQQFNVRVNWNYRSRQRGNAVAPGASIEPGTYNWALKRLNVDVSGEYYIRSRIAVFANLRNVGAAKDDNEVFGPSTPAHAQFR